MLAGDVAWAHVQIIRPDYTKNDLVAEVPAERQAKRNLRLVESIIRATGGTFETRFSTETRTDWMRRGIFVVNPGTAGADTSFDIDATISMYVTRPINISGMARPDSLVRALLQSQRGNIPQSTKPILMVRDNTCPITASEGAASLFGTLDSAGYKQYDEGAGKVVYRAGRPPGFLTHSYMVGATDGYDTGDKRDILFSRYQNYVNRGSKSETGSGRVACSWCDSIPSYAASDTVILWERQFDSYIPYASRMVFVMGWGAGAFEDSISDDGITSNGGFAGTEGEFPVLLAALAHLDSIVRATSTSGGSVLGDKQIKIAPVIYGGLARGERHAWKSPGSAQGILASDTSVFYAGLDSLRSLGIPVTFAINPDSAASYARDLIKMKENPFARFAPQVWNGVSDTSKAGGQNPYYRPVDVFGRYRARAAVGDESGLGSDSSIAGLAKSSLRLVDSLVGRARVSPTAVAPDDDWSPLNVDGVLKGSDRVPIDSVLYALRLAGFSSVISDGNDPDASAFKRHGPSATNPRGYYQKQQKYSLKKFCVDDINILSHAGYAITGGSRQMSAGATSFPDDSSTTTGGAGIIYKEIARAWTGALMGHDNSYDTWGYDGNIINYDRLDIDYRRADHLNSRFDPGLGIQGGNIFRLSCADLSGVPNGPPALNGFHALKAIKAAMDIVNWKAGRTIVRFCYPEDIEP